jgi:uncharacterized protein with HEPN domain
MKHPERIEDYLENIAQAIDRAASYLEPVSSVEAFEKNPQAQDAVIRNIEIIGEAANRIQRQAPEFVAAHSSLPWRDMRDMRNRMIHHYFDVNLDVVWSTVKDDLPKLKQQIDGLLIDLKRDPDRER